MIRLPAAAAAIAAVFAAAIAGCGGGDKTSTQTAPAKSVAPRLVTQQQLAAYAKTLPHPLYWAGPRQDLSYELTRTTDGSSYVRYLPKGVSAGDPRPIFLTVGTYPRPNAFAIVQQAAKHAPGSALSLAGGGLGVPSPRNAKSIYVSYPKSPVLVEVFSADPAQSRLLVKRQAIVPLQPDGFKNR